MRKICIHWAVPIGSMALSAALAVILGQDSGFDLLNYHYYSGFALLHKPFGYDFAVAQIQSFHNPLMHVFSYLTLAHLSARSAAAALGAAQGLNFYLVFRISQILLSALPNPYRYILGLACAGVGFYGLTSTTELGATYGDNLVSIPVLAGLLLILSCLRTGEMPGKKAAAYSLFSGLLLGAALGLKFTSAMYLLGWMIAFPLSCAGLRGCVRSFVAAACGSFFGFLATYGFWGVHLFLSCKNPVFPYLNRIFQSPYFGSGNFFDDRFLPRNWPQALFYPFYFIRKNSLVSEVQFRDIRFALCYIVIIGLAAVVLIQAFRAKSRPAIQNQTDRCLVFLAVFFAVSYASWIKLSSIYRYLAVLELLAPVFLALVAHRFLKIKSAALLSAGCMVLISVSAVPISFGRIPYTNDLLKLQTPRIHELNRSVVLMSGYDPISYIVPSFPDPTRFVRVSSTFTTPGKSQFLDAKIRDILVGYDARHRFAYVQNVQEIGEARLDASRYGIKLDAKSCYELKSRDRKQNQGYLCGVAGEPVRTDERPVAELRYNPKFAGQSGVALTGSASGSFFNATVAGIGSGLIDILYELDGEVMPVIRRWALVDSGTMHLGPFSRTGNIGIIGIRGSNAPEPDTWIPVNANFRIQAR